MKLPTENELWAYFWKEGLDPTIRSYGPGKSATSRRFEATISVPVGRQDGIFEIRDFNGIGHRRDIALRRLLNELARSKVLPELAVRLQDVPALAHGTGHRTEHEGIPDPEKLSEDLQTVLRAFSGRTAGLTDFELADRVDVGPDGAHRKRRSHLAALGLVEPLVNRDGTTAVRPNPKTGRHSIVWVLTPEAEPFVRSWARDTAGTLF